jgi:hypothetical protein
MSCFMMDVHGVEECYQYIHIQERNHRRGPLAF